MLVYVLYFGANVFLYVIIVFYPQLLAGFEVASPLLISLYLAANGVAGGISAALYERLLRLLNRHHLVAIALLLWILAFTAATLANSALTAVPSVLAFGFGQGLVFPSAFAWIESLAPADKKGQFSSYLASAGWSGQFISPVTFGPLVPLFGLRGVFAAAAMLVTVGALAAGVALTRSNTFN